MTTVTAQALQKLR